MKKIISWFFIGFLALCAGIMVKALILQRWTQFGIPRCDWKVYFLGVDYIALCVCGVLIIIYEMKKRAKK